jgi:para-aminobenzoate synthetase component 1
MKGTIDASIPDAEQIILADPKETEEHRAAVDLLADDLRRIACNVRVERFRYIDRLKTSEREILQTSSELVGELPEEWQARLGDIILSMLPAGSIAGAPKASTLDVIRRAEPEPRGFYTGVFGYFDGLALDSGVLIRFIEERDGRQFYRSGGGITAASDWQKEYREVLDKIYLPR